MVEYTKPWLSLEQQVERLASRGIDVGDRDRAAAVLKAVGYYRLTGYLYPFRESEQYADDDGRERTRVLGGYRAGTTLGHAEDLIDFDRRLRMLVMDGVERIEVAVRMQLGYVLGRTSAFAHENPACFTEAFTAPGTDPESGEPNPSSHARWLERAGERRAKSDEQFVVHFREKYDDRMPVWALTELLELGQLSVLYRGLRQQDAEEIALAFGAPTKKTMVSWLASLNYVRNVAAHHARLFNRKLQNAPARPKAGQVPPLDHLRDEQTSKGVFGTYNALAVIAHLLPAIEAGTDWHRRLAELLQGFPTSNALSVASIGVPQGWESLELWQR
ncbi:Abi family protein [Prauserella flavalba]|uniref:Abortive phage infection protein n=1 Tax=Prauserella flavalba TaxID=1477506 RepID=A0A318LK03_9PSEU|nr:Abi family protein [Prauserella flavalba]PXY33758.1 abortive phage infection protein [Prauserella flavalba]